jgi:polysaccharide export outer membrane protein
VAAAPAPATLAGAPSSGDRNYVLGIGDTIDVAVLGRSDFNAHARIGTDGAVLLPYLGAFPATNRSPGQLADEVRVALEKGGFFSNPVVRVDVVGVASRYVTVLGAVQTPGLVALDRQYRLSEIIARAGGRAAAGADTVVVTRGDSPPQKYRIADLATGVGDKDPVVEMGDKIYVPAAEAEIYYITGAVKAPGAFAVSGEMTVRQALARAGGVGDTGSEKKIKINRKGAEIKNVKLDETRVEPGDIINVGERLF